MSGLSRKKTTNPLVQHFELQDFVWESYDDPILTEWETIEFIDVYLKLKTVKSYLVDAKTVVAKYKNYMEKLRDKLDYDIDGLVIKANSKAIQVELGVVHGRPKGQIALKFPSSSKMTKLKDVIWQVGLTGRITPVALVEPVEIGGVTIQRVSLHNTSNMKELNVYKGADILVSRRNDVIPYIEKVTSDGPEDEDVGAS